MEEGPLRVASKGHKDHVLVIYQCLRLHDCAYKDAEMPRQEETAYPRGRRETARKTHAELAQDTINMAVSRG